MTPWIPQTVRRYNKYTKKMSDSLQLLSFFFYLQLQCDNCFCPSHENLYAFKLRVSSRGILVFMFFYTQ